MPRYLTTKEISEAVSNPKKHSPELKRKAETLGRKMEKLSPEEIAKLSKKAEEKYGI